MRGIRRLIGVSAAVAALTASVAVMTAPASPPAAAASGAASAPAGCQLANGVKHVINITFDNVHLSRDNANVPSDLEQMPHLMSWLQQNGTILSNMHTPLIAHTADDSLSIYTGLYGDRHGQPVTNSYKSYHPDGTTEPDGSFTYWNSPTYKTTNPPGASPTDSSPSMVYSPTVPATSTPPNTITPAPWVPFTRAGCSVGDFSTANMVLENTNLDIPTVFGANSPENQQLNADPDRFKDPETADYVGVAVHCAQGDAICASAQATKYGQTSPSPSAVADQLPDEPGGYTGFQGLFGHKYVAPQLGAGTPYKTTNGYAVTNSAGNLVDLKGNEIDNSFTHGPGFPGFSPLATQSLAYLADMLEAGIPVTYGYISDLHERKSGTSGCTTAGAGTGYALGPGDKCYVNNAAAYDAAFQTFFDRLAADGMTPSNTLLVVGAEEQDHFAGANAGRASAPTAAGCDGVTVPCNYASGQIGELNANLPGLLATQRNDTTPFDVEPQGAAMYVHGQPAADDPAVRQLERDTAALTNPHNPYSGADNEKIVNYQAGATEQEILHMQTADPLRTPTYTVFPKGDYYFAQGPANCNSNCIPQLSRYAWDHGYYAPDIDITWSAFAGPGVAVHGIDGPAPNQGAEATDPNGDGTVPQFSNQGTWADETDVRPTLLHLLGLRDDYQADGRVVSELLATPSPTLAAAQDFGACYKQLNASVGEFGTNTLTADSNALASGSASDDSQFARTEKKLGQLGRQRDQLAAHMKQVLADAAAGTANPDMASLQQSCQDVLAKSAQLAAGGG